MQQQQYSLTGSLQRLLSTASLPQTAWQAPQLSEKFLVLENRSQEYVHVKRFVLHTALSIAVNTCADALKSLKNSCLNRVTLLVTTFFS